MFQIRNETLRNEGGRLAVERRARATFQKEKIQRFHCEISVFQMFIKIHR